MKLYNVLVNNETHLAIEKEDELVDLTLSGFTYNMNDVVAGLGVDEINELLKKDDLPICNSRVYGNIIDNPKKIVCVGLNYKAHAEEMELKLPEYPTLFSKYSDALVPCDSEVELFPWETTYECEGELVIVIGKDCFNINEQEAEDYIFGYSIGNDLSLRDGQFRTSQWLIGKSMPAFGPVGPCIVSKDEFNPFKPMLIASYVNGEKKQEGLTTEMIFDVKKIVSYTSKYLKLSAGDLIFTGTPSGLVKERKWLKANDIVEVKIEGIGTLVNKMVQR